MRAPGLLLLAGAAMALAACDGDKPLKKPAAEVVLADDAAVQTPASAARSDETPGFASVANAPVAQPERAASGDQAVTGTIVDFLCNSNTPASRDDDAPTAACELIIRTPSRGDRRMLCDVAPCDAWAARGNLPQGIRGLQAEAWITLADTFDASGAPMGRVAKVTLLNVTYSTKS